MQNNISAEMKDTQNAIVDGVNLMNIHVETTDHNHMYKDTGVLATGPISTDLKMPIKKN